MPSARDLLLGSAGLHRCPTESTHQNPKSQQCTTTCERCLRPLTTWGKCGEDFVARSLCRAEMSLVQDFRVEAMGLEPTNLLTASQALYQLSYAPESL